MKKVTNVRKNNNGVITHLKVDGLEKTRDYVYKDLSLCEYYTYPNGLEGSKGSKIHKVGKYISTNPNENKSDNLDYLESF